MYGTVNGYDSQGGLWFSRDTETAFECEAACREAYEIVEVVDVMVSICPGILAAMVLARATLQP